MSRKWSVMEPSLHINLLELSVVENAIQRQRQIQTDLIVDRQFNSGLLHQSPGRKKICSHVRNDMDDSTLMSLLGCTASKSTQSWERM